MAAAALLQPWDLDRFGKYLAATSVFLSNIPAWLEGGNYFRQQNRARGADSSLVNCRRGAVLSRVPAHLVFDPQVPSPATIRGTRRARGRLAHAMRVGLLSHTVGELLPGSRQSLGAAARSDARFERIEVERQPCGERGAGDPGFAGAGWRGCSLCIGCPLSGSLYRRPLRGCGVADLCHRRTRADRGQPAPVPAAVGIYRLDFVLAIFMAPPRPSIVSILQSTPGRHVSERRTAGRYLPARGVELVGSRTADSPEEIIQIGSPIYAIGGGWQPHHARRGIDASDIHPRGVEGSRRAARSPIANGWPTKQESSSA